MVASADSFSFSYTEFPTGSLSVNIDKSIIRPVYQFVLDDQSRSFHAQGFYQGAVSPRYIERTCRLNILEHLKELFLNHCVVNYVCSGIRDNKILMIGDPRLVNAFIDPDASARFDFEFAPIRPLLPKGWKNFPFRPPSRKGYKDIDKQAIAFIEEETKAAAVQAKVEPVVSAGDWVRFSVQIVVNRLDRCCLGYRDILWLKITGDQVNTDLATMFVGKRVGETILTTHDFFQNYISNKINTEYEFAITLLDIIPHAFFSFDLFKHQFYLESKQDIHSKLVEVLSMRNDIPLRREVISAALKLLTNSSTISVSHGHVEKEEDSILTVLRENPDYNVFRQQSNFKELVHSLAEQQLKESIVLDALAFEHELTVADKDVHAYLNLLKRPRTKDFVYFLVPSTKLYNQDVPIPEEYLKRFCLREKALNYLIHYLTRA